MYYWAIKSRTYDLYYCQRFLLLLLLLFIIVFWKIIVNVGQGGVSQGLVMQGLGKVEGVW